MRKGGKWCLSVWFLRSIDKVDCGTKSSGLNVRNDFLERCLSEGFHHKPEDR